MEIITNSAAETKKLAKSLAKKIKAPCVIALYGDLGSGKTTFIQGFVAGLGIKDKVQSPTFVFVRLYGTKPIIYHIDLYRIENIKYAEGIGLSEFITDPNGITLIEWPEVVESQLPANTIKIRFDHLEGDSRKISW